MGDKGAYFLRRRRRLRLTPEQWLAIQNARKVEGERSLLLAMARILAEFRPELTPLIAEVESMREPEPAAADAAE